jgi:tRNA A37 methylthiotransferase MiaB
LVRFLSEARLDAIGVFDYSDEDGTEAASLPGKVSRAAVKRRYEKLLALADELCAQRAEERLGDTVEVLIDTVDDGVVEGRGAHQAPEVDGSTTLVGDGSGVDLGVLRPGDLVRATVTGTEGVDLLAVPTEMVSAAPVVRQ